MFAFVYASNWNAFYFFLFIHFFFHSLSCINRLICTLAMMRELIRFLHFGLLFISSTFFCSKKFQINANRFGWLWQFHLNKTWRKTKYCEWSYASKANRHKRMCERASEWAHKSQHIWFVFFFVVVQLNCLYKYIS